MVRRSGMVAVAGCSVAAYRLRKRLRLPAPLTTAWLFAVPVSLARAADPSFGRDMAVWGAQMWAYKNTFELPADHPERHRSRVHVDYPLRSDGWLGGGTAPTHRLQRRLRRSGHLSRLDKALSLFYMTWEAEPHLALAAVRHRRPQRFPAAAGRLAAAFDLTLLGYWAVPTAPPWWASEKAGRMHGEVHRVMKEVLRWLQRQDHPTRGDNQSPSANSFASMPSDHFATATMTAIVLGDIDPRLGAAGWAYALLLGFALVYLGEHYVTDLLAGAGVDAGDQPRARAAGAAGLWRSGHRLTSAAARPGHRRPRVTIDRPQAGPGSGSTKPSRPIS